MILKQGSFEKTEPTLMLIFSLIRHWVSKNSLYDITILKAERYQMKFFLTENGPQISPVFFINRLLVWVNVEFMYDKTNPEEKTLAWLNESAFVLRIKEGV